MCWIVMILVECSSGPKNVLRVSKKLRVGLPRIPHDVAIPHITSLLPHTFVVLNDGVGHPPFSGPLNPFGDKTQRECWLSGATVTARTARRAQNRDATHGVSDPQHPN